MSKRWSSGRDLDAISEGERVDRLSLAAKNQNYRLRGLAGDSVRREELATGRSKGLRYDDQAAMGGMADIPQPSRSVRF